MTCLIVFIALLVLGNFAIYRFDPDLNIWLSLGANKFLFLLVHIN